MTALITGLDLGRALGRSRVPVELEPQRVLHLDDAGAGEVGVAATAAGVRGQAVDVGEGQPGVGDRLLRGLDGEVDARCG